MRVTTMLVVSALSVAAHGGRAAAQPYTALSRSLGSAGYKWVARKGGVTIFKHRRDKVLAAEGVLRRSPAAVQRALLAYGQHARTNRRIARSRVLARGNSWLRVYQLLRLPVVDDRDYTLRVRWGSWGNGVRWTKFRTTTRGPGPRRGVVRIKVHEGSWQLRAHAAGRSTFARYQVRIDLGGWVPAWLVRSSTEKELPLLFTAISRLAARYEQAGRAKTR